MKNNYKNVDDYIFSQSEKLIPMLMQIRSLVVSVAPDAAEMISFSLPCYKYHGMLVGFGAHKKGCSFYAMNPAILASYAKELVDFKYTGATIHLDPALPLPVAILKKIIRRRIRENEEKMHFKEAVNNKKGRTVR